ncbi:MAG: hypothetical protein JWP91_4276 [Fibrobacteres bacterium]|nr:hypothetical protein [Fibrobacterota bacterium]
MPDHSRGPGSEPTTVSARPIPLAGFLLAASLLLSGADRADAAGYFDGRHYPIITDAVFTADEFILDQARFWFAIYAEVGDDEGLLHDPFYPDMVFRKVSAPGQGRASAKMAEAHVHALQDEVRALLAKDTASWTPKDRELRSRFPAFWDSTGIMLSVERIRFQRGLKGKYRAGLERSYRYLPLIDSIFAAQGVPERLRYLPHVESSFYPYAYSKVGAAGMWQFMKSSAKLFKMKVGYQVDERRDPHASTLAASKMLMYNFRWLKSWPLAIVAYNHGPGGLARAARETGTRDLGTIIKSYYSNSFGFASKNFYAEFLAASSIAMKADSIFPDLRKMEPLRFQYLVLSKPVGVRFLCTLTGLTPAELEEYNLGLRPATFRGNSQLPKGFALKLPFALDLAAVSGKLGGQVLASNGTIPRQGAAPAVQAPVAVAMAEPSAVPASAVTEALPAATLPLSAAQDKVDNAQGNADPLAAQPGKKQGRKARERDRRAAAEAKPQTSISAAGQTRSETRENAREAARRLALEKARETEEGGTPARPIPTAPLPKTEPQSAPLASLSRPQAPAVPGVAPAAPQPAGATRPDERIIDSSLALQASDIDKLAHPMDRFNPSIYNLEYAYADGSLTFQVGTEETLSHYAEWAWIPEKTLRTINKLRNPKDFRMGRRMRIPLAEDKAKEFVKRREEYYRAIEEDFYSNYYVSMTEPLPVTKGMNLWNWAQERELPFWLLQKHNPGKALNEVRVGDTLSLPVIETGIRKWGFTRYGSSKEYLTGISRYLASGKAEAY